MGGQIKFITAASKAGLISLTMSIAKNYSEFGVTCNAIAPGLVKTDMSSREYYLKMTEKILSVQSVELEPKMKLRPRWVFWLATVPVTLRVKQLM